MKKTIAGEFDIAADLDEVVFPHSSASEGTHATEYFDEGDVFPLAAGPGGETNAGSSSAVASIETLANWLINGFWQNQGALPHRWTSSTITYNLGNLNAQEQALALSALNAWHDVANIKFVAVSSGANIAFNHNGTMQAVTTASWTGAGRMTSATVNISTDWVTTDGGANDGKTGVDSYAYQTYIHEIGHALGLGHQGPYNGSANYSVDAIFANDTWQYSIMSYFPQSNYGGSYRYVITPQVADIYAAAVMYGAATTTRTGDTVYGFNATAGSLYNFASYVAAPALTIYDNGGVDTLDCSGYSASQTIDLRAGNFSSVGGLTNNIGIALGVVIEKGVGGSGSDTLIANDGGCSLSGGGGGDTLIGGAGADLLIGGAGRDVMVGNGGADTFAFAPGDSPATIGQHDLVTDFTSADRVDISAIGSFRFLGTTAFDGGTYALNFVYNSLTGLTTLQGDINGDKVADFAIDFTGIVTFNATYVIGAVQPSSVVIEAAGATSLVQSGGGNYLLNPAGGGTGPVLQFGGSAVSVGQFAGWTPVGAEATASGYLVAWYNSGTDAYTFWRADNAGVLTGGPPLPVAANDPAVQSFESELRQDLNGDGLIGPGTVIEPFGVTSLVQAGSNYFLNPVQGGRGPVLQFEGSAVSVGQFAGWAPIGAEMTASGYVVAWYNAGIAAYIFWYADRNGALSASPPGPVAVTDPAVLTFESSLHQDLNGDGVIAPPTVIEAFGTTSLNQSGCNYFLGVAGPVLQFGGSVVWAGQFGGWTPIGAEATASGYAVAWFNIEANAYAFWSADTSGELTATIPGSVAANDPKVQSFESDLHQDLNGDGIIGPAMVIESLGTTSLIEGGNTYHLNPVKGGAGPTLQLGGSAVSVDQFAGWAPIGAETTADGYIVAWHNAGTDAYIFWSADRDGILQGGPPGPVSADNPLVQTFESSLHQDLNGDGVIAPPTVIEALGTTSLVQSGVNYLLGSSGPVLQFEGSAVRAGQFAGWTPVATEASAGGYEVAWYNAGDNAYTFWHAESSGALAFSYTGPVAANNPVVRTFEDSFHQDFDGDGIVGQPMGPISSSMESKQAGQEFNFKPDLGTQTSIPHTVDASLPLYSSYDAVRSVIEAAVEHSAPVLDAENAVQKVPAHSDQFFFH